MPATILDYTAGTTERGVKLQNSQIFRKIKNDTWTHIRVGVRWICDDDSLANPTAGSQFALGLCNGDAEGMGSTNRKHCLVATNLNSSGNLSNLSRQFSSDTYFSLTFTPGANYAGKYINNVLTLPGGPLVSSLAVGPFVAAGINGTFYSPIFFFDIIRDTPNYSVNGFIHTASTPGASAIVSRPVFLSQMEALTPSLVNYQYGVLQTIAVDETTDGVLDHFHFYWNRSAPSIILLDVAVAKIA